MAGGSDGESPSRWRPVQFPFGGSDAAARAIVRRMAALPPHAFPRRAAHRGALSGRCEQVGLRWSASIKQASPQDGGSAPVVAEAREGAPKPSARLPARRQGDKTASNDRADVDGAAPDVQHGGDGDPATGHDDDEPRILGLLTTPPQATARTHIVRVARQKLLVSDYVHDALLACIQRACGLPSSRPLEKTPSPVTAVVIGDKMSRSRAIVLRSGTTKRDTAIVWVSCRDGLLCSCFTGTQNALFLSASSRSTKCQHTASLAKALASSGMTREAFCARMRLRADCSDFAVPREYGSTIVWSVLYHSVFSIVTFSSGNVAACVAPGCRRFRGRCGHVRVARSWQGPDGFLNVDTGSAPQAVRARIKARASTSGGRPSTFVKNEEEDEGLEQLAGDTERDPKDADASTVLARTSRNLLPCAGEVAQGTVWTRTADWRDLISSRPEAEQAGAQHGNMLATLLQTGILSDAIRDTRRPLVEPYCGSCGQQRAERHKVVTEPALLTTHHPSAAPLRVSMSTPAMLCGWLVSLSHAVVPLVGR